MFRSWKLGSAFGIGIFVHPSLLLLPLFLVLWNLPGGGLSTVAFVLALLPAVLVCVVLHELGHALMARWFGIGTRDITLYPIGGVARLEKMSEHPLEEMCIALAGPAVNGVIVAVLLALGAGTLGALQAGGVSLTASGLQESFVVSYLAALTLTNLFMAVFNLIPAFPMDGGRVLRALLSLLMPRLQATEIAVYFGVVVTILLGLVFLFVWFSPMVLLVAGFVFLMGQAELATLRRREAELAVEPVEVPEVEPVVEYPQTRAAFTGIVWDVQRRLWVVWEDGRPVGVFNGRT
jgi:Zn-dependent protease